MSMTGLEVFDTGDCVETERVARSVFSVLESHVSGGEIEDVKRVLPAEVRELWP